MFADHGSIVQYTVGSGAMSLVVAPVGGDGIVLRDPAASPDGKRIAYVRREGPAVTPGRPADQLWIAARDGKDPHPSLQEPGLEIAHPQWLDDSEIVAIVRAAGRSTLERIEAGSGQRTLLAAGVVDFALSRDRQRIVLARPSAAGTVALFTADASGGNERALPDQQAFSAVGALTLSPDAESLAVGATVVTGSAAAPWQVWSVPLSGGSPRAIAALADRVNGLAFGRNGQLLYALTSAALDEVTVATGRVRRLRDTGDTTSLTWTH
ncbi:MAG TPA: LpqB family beta-propeller domain-containing protein [Dehalococcoidia bacterium]|nr:LpqB family beta-propeller domain-containing protein [Dehalococcoidia bacterium]